MPKFNPFVPDKIVFPDRFAGRTDEILALGQALYQTKNGNPTHFLVHGERGIGKSSLLLYIDDAAKGRYPSLGKIMFSFITVTAVLEPHDTYHSIIHKIARELQREIDKNANVQKALVDVWDFITNWEVMGVKYNKNLKDIPPEQMLEELADKLVEMSIRTNSDFHGIYIFIDEADKPDETAHLGEFIKQLTERLTRKKAYHVAIGVFGISNVIDKMRNSHASSVRILTSYELKPLLIEERKQVINRGLELAGEKSGTAYSVVEEALIFIANISEGYPHFLQQYAYSSFEEDKDNVISTTDVSKGILKKHGALDQLGIRYFDNMYTGQISSENYRLVLQTMALENTEYVSRKIIKGKTGLSEAVLNNAISALLERCIIIPQKGIKGSYKLPSNSFRTWLRAFKIEEKESNKPTQSQT